MAIVAAAENMNGLIGKKSADNSHPLSLYDVSDTTDDKNPLNITECLRLHSGNVKVHGTIAGISRLYKMVKSITLECKNCGSQQTFKYRIPVDYPKNVTNQICNICRADIKEAVAECEYVNAIAIEIQDSDTFSEIEKLSCILFDDNTKGIQIGSKVVISGSIQIIKQKK